MWKRYTPIVAVSFLAALIGLCVGCGAQDELAPQGDSESASPEESQPRAPEPEQPEQPGQPGQPGQPPGQPGQPGGEPGQPGLLEDPEQ